MAPPPLIHCPPSATVVTSGDFPWPDFDRWQAAFASAGIFPPRWEGLERSPSPRSPEADAYHLKKLVLFSEWREMLALRPTVQAHYARRGLRARVVRQDDRVPCPPCDGANGREMGPELDVMPPFHPGCRCVVVAMHAVPLDRRGRSYERPPSRLG
jgi:hypothetical protein